LALIFENLKFNRISMSRWSAAAATADDAATMADAIEARMRLDVISGSLEPRSALRMGSLKERYGVGTSPLREALTRLTGEGLVELEPNKGFRVKALSAEDLADIAYMRTALETAAIRTAIARGTDAWEADILATLHRLIKATERTGTDRDSLDGWQMAHDAFHQALVSACGSPRLLAEQRRLADQHARYRRYLMNDNFPRELLIQEHKGLAEAALARDADRAAELMAAHLMITSEFYAGLLQRGEKRLPPV
jgi:GntR family transcriptional regulator, carbon starvation induced regulator